MVISSIRYHHPPTGKSALEPSLQGSRTQGEGGSSSLTVKNVVTVFVSHHRRILLLRRSDRVGSYRGRWAGISGYVEQNEDPLRRAVKEISEEVGLTSMPSPS